MPNKHDFSKFDVSPQGNPMSDLLDGPFGRVEMLRNNGETRYATIDMECNYSKIDLVEQITHHPNVDSGKVNALSHLLCLFLVALMFAHVSCGVC